MRKFILVALMITLVSVFLAATTLTVIGPWAGAEMDKFMPVLEKFEKEYGIDIEYRTYRAEDLANILPAQFASKKTLGDVIFMWPWFVLDQAKKGYVMDVSDVIDESEYLPGVLDNVKLDGKLYGAAYTGKVKPGFWYRKSFFEKHNLSVPKTWNEFVTLLEKIKNIPGIKAPIASGDGVGWPLSDVTEHFIIAFAGPNVHRDLIAGNIKWQSFTVRSAFEKLTFLLEKGYFGEPTEWTLVLKQWWNGDYGLYFMGSWITGMVDDPNDLGVFSLPGIKGIVFGADYAFVPKYTKYPKEAKMLLKYLCGLEGQTEQVKQGGHVATIKNVPLDVYPTVDREVAKLLEGVEALFDLDDSIGGAFQTAFWDQLKLLWVRPGRLDDILEILDEKMK